MSSHYRYLTALLIAAVMLLPALTYTPDGARADPDPPDEDEAAAGSGYTYLDRDWYVDASDDLYYGNQTILLDGNLTINGTGRLVLSNVTLIMNCTLNSTYHISVLANGTLEVMNGSTITAPNASVPYYMLAMADSNLTMRDSRMRYAGVSSGFPGLTVYTDNVTVERCNLTECKYPMALYGDDILVEDCVFYNCTGITIWGYYAENLTVRNNNFLVGTGSIDISESSGRIIGNTHHSNNNNSADYIKLLKCQDMDVVNNSIDTISIGFISLNQCQRIKIIANELGKDKYEVANGIYIYYSSQVNVSDNYIRCSKKSLVFDGSTNCSVHNNEVFTSRGHALDIHPYSRMKYLLHDISNTNTNYSRTIRYIKHQDNPTLPIGDDMTILVDCHNITITNRAVPTYYDALFMGYCSDITLNKVNSSHGFTVYLDRCWNGNLSQVSTDAYSIDLNVVRSKHITLYRCNLTEDGYYAPTIMKFESEDGAINRCTLRKGVYVKGDRTQILGCYMKGNINGTNDALRITERKCLISRCDFTYPSLGMTNLLLVYGMNHEIERCIFSNKNGSYAALTLWGSNNIVHDSTFLNNQYADIRISGASNSVRDCIFNGSYSNILFNAISQNNKVYHNNLYQVSATPIIGTLGTNALDNGYGEGNYWEDYDGEDDGSNDRWPHDGVGDTKIPHHFDNYPMMNPWQWYLPFKPVIKTICPVEGYNSTGEYNVTWDYAHNATSYLFQESEFDDFSVITSSLETPNTRVWVAGKTNDTYYYRVKALNEWGESPWSDVRFIVVDHPPFTPAGLAVETFPDGNSIRVEWQRVEGDVARYQLHYTTDGDSEWHQVAELDHPTNTTNHHGLVDGRNYTYRVRSLDERGTPSPWSGEVTGVPVDTVAPAMPGGLQIASTKDDSVTLIWQPNAEADLAGYNIYRLDVTDDGRGTRDIGGGYSQLNPPPPEKPWKDPYYVDRAVESGRKYSYTITALDEVPNESLPAYDVLAEIPKGNRAPEIGNIQYDVEMDEDSVDEESIDLFHWFKDPDGNDLLFSVKGAKHFEVTIFQSSGQVTLEPRADWNGHENLTFTAYDGEYKVNDTVMVTVTFVNDAPVDAYILTPADGSEAEEGAAVNFSGTAEDIDVQYGDELTYAWKSNISGPLGLGKELSVATLAPGLHYITLTASDLAGVSTNTSMHLTVVPKKIIEPPDGTEDGGDDNISDGENGDDPPPPDGGDPDGGDGGDDDKGLLGGEGAVAVVVVLVIVMALVMLVVLMSLRKKRRELERLKKEEEEMGPALEGEVASLPGKPLKTGPVPIPKPMPKPMPVLPEGPKAEELDGEWELAQEEGPSPVLRSESIMKDPFSKKRREVVEAEIEEGEE